MLLTLGVYTQIESVSVDKFYEQKKLTENPQIIDIRTPQEFKDGKICGAINIDSRSAEFQTKINSLNKEKPVLIYCTRGVRSKFAMEILQQLGFTIVYELDGGINEWIRAGKPVKKQTP